MFYLGVAFLLLGAWQAFKNGRLSPVTSGASLLLGTICVLIADWRIALSYLIPLAILATIELPFLPFTFGIVPTLRKAKWFSPIVAGLLDAVKIFAGVLAAGWLIGLIGQAPSWLMFLIPGYLICYNDLSRIRRVKAGSSNVKRMLELAGEPESYDYKNDLKIEQAHLVGDIVGWVVGSNIVLAQSAGFF